EDFPQLGMPCDNGLSGACLTMGIWVCKPDGSGVMCTAAPVSTGVEVCNGLDDDCDGIPDDNLGAPIGDACGGTGSCGIGVLACVGGSIQCVGASGGSPEVCNGVDDDCDGFIDEPPVPGTGLDCTDPGFESIGDTGECEFGHTECIGGALTCVDYKG